MVKKIHIENFKSIYQAKVHLTNLNILIGQNGAGKSNFISLFHFLERLCDQQLSDHVIDSGGIESFLFGGYDQSNYIKIYLEISVDEDESIYNTYEFKILGSGDDYKFSEELIGFWSKNQYNEPYHHSIGSLSKEAELKKYKFKRERNGYIARHIFNYMKEWKIYHFHDTSVNAKSRLSQNMDDLFSLKKEAENIAVYLYFLKKKYYNDYLKIVHTIHLVYPMFHDFVLEESPLAKGKIELRWTEKGSDHVFSSKQISDGTLRFICLATLLLQPNLNGTIVLDEPELGLHPFAIHVLAELLQKASLKAQLILATQSVTLINHFKPNDLLIAERSVEDGGTELKRLENEKFSEWLDDYTLGQLWENNFFGGRP